MQNKQTALRNLNNEALGQLFPIALVKYQSQWKTEFLKERDQLQMNLGSTTALRIEHFGSTAVPDLSAKPTIDILIEIPVLNDPLKMEIIRKMELMNYETIWRTDEAVPYLMFVKGYTPEGYKGQSFHVHMGDANHSLWDRIYFRDHLIAHPETAREYEELKYKLATKFKFDRDGYTLAKSEFVMRVTALAKIKYSNQSDSGIS